MTKCWLEFKERSLSPPASFYQYSANSSSWKRTNLSIQSSPPAKKVVRKCHSFSLLPKPRFLELYTHQSHPIISDNIIHLVFSPLLCAFSTNPWGKLIVGKRYMLPWGGLQTTPSIFSNASYKAWAHRVHRRRPQAFVDSP